MRWGLLVEVWLPLSRSLVEYGLVEDVGVGRERLGVGCTRLEPEMPERVSSVEEQYAREIRRSWTIS